MKKPSLPLILLYSIIPGILSYISVGEAHITVLHPLSAPSFFLYTGEMIVGYKIVYGLPSLLFLGTYYYMHQLSELKSYKTTTITITTFTLLSAVFVVSGIKTGIQFQGKQFTYLIIPINFIWMIALWYVWLRLNFKSYRYKLLIMLTIFFSWIFWCAFPWLGEI